MPPRVLVVNTPSSGTRSDPAPPTLPPPPQLPEQSFQDESQSSLAWQLAMGVHSQPVPHAPTDNSEVQQDASLDASLIAGTQGELPGSAPRLHLHGLGQTQSQSQRASVDNSSRSEDVDHDSQKENTPAPIISSPPPAANKSIFPPPPRSPLLHVPATTTTGSPFVVPSSSSPSRSVLPSPLVASPTKTPSRPTTVASPKQPTKIAPLLEPLPQQATLISKAHKKAMPPLRPSSPASQDSFAIPDPRDSPRRFIEQSRALNTITVGGSEDNYTSQDETRSSPMWNPWNPAQRSTSSLGRSSSPSPPPAGQGHVLVARTPSTQSTNQSLEPIPTQVVHSSHQSPSYHPSNPSESQSQSQSRIRDDFRLDSEPVEATQVATQATQVDDEPAHSVVPDSNTNDTEHTTAPSSIATRMYVPVNRRRQYGLPLEVVAETQATRRGDELNPSRAPESSPTNPSEQEQRTENTQREVPIPPPHLFPRAIEAPSRSPLNAKTPDIVLPPHQVSPQKGQGKDLYTTPHESARDDQETPSAPAPPKKPPSRKAAPMAPPLPKLPITERTDEVDASLPPPKPPPPKSFKRKQREVASPTETERQADPDMEEPPTKKTRGRGGRRTAARGKGKAQPKRKGKATVQEIVPSSEQVRQDQETHDEQQEENLPATPLVEEPPADLPPRGQKRKRGSGVAPQASSSRLTKQPRRPTTPMSKRTASPPSFNVSMRSKILPRKGTRVFARWKDKFYYPGTIVGPSAHSASQYRVEFDDGDEALVELSHMRRCEFKMDDLVDVTDNKTGAVGEGRVVEIEAWDEEGVIRVDMGDLEVDVHSEHLRLSARSITEAWGDRMLVVDEILGTGSRTPKRVASFGSVRGLNRAKRVLFPRTAFVLTFNPSADAVAQQKESLTAAIRDGGGVVVNDWSELFEFDGTTVNVTGGKRWVGGKEGVSWIGDKGEEGQFEKVFLIADRSTQTAKYLMGLALGVPCVSLEWVRDRVQGETADWRSYILSAGYSESLGAECSQWIDQRWGERPNQLADIMHNPTLRRVFANKSILCIGKTFKQVKGGQFYPLILCAMGAVRVEVVAEAAHASDKTQMSFDYVIVDSPQQTEEGIVAAGVDWLKQCLISGRVLPLD